MAEVPVPPKARKDLLEWFAKFIAGSDDVPEDPRTGEDYPDQFNSVAGQYERAKVAAREWNRMHRHVILQPHTKIILSGTIGTGRETFSLGLRGHFFKPGTQDAGDLSDDAKSAWLATVVQPAVTAFWTNGTTGIGGEAVLTRITAAKIGANGKYAEKLPPYVALKVAGADTGGHVKADHPWSVSIAVTLRSHLAKTSQGRIGRFYLPCPVFTVNPTDDTINPQDAAALAKNVGDMMNTINAGPTGDDALAWEFRLYGDGVRKDFPDSEGPTNRVDTVQVGNVLDTIRSRRNSGGENYSTIALQ